MVVLSVLMWHWAEHEPWFFFEGVSSVPALALGVTTIVYAMCFWWIARGRRAQGHNDIAETFKLRKPAKAKALDFNRRCAAISIWRSRVTSSDGGSLSGYVDDVWSEYLSMGQWRTRTVRNAIQFGVSGLALIVASIVLGHAGSVFGSRSSVLDHGRGIGDGALLYYGW